MSCMFYGEEKAKRLLVFILVFLVILGFAWNGWWLWAAINFFLGGHMQNPWIRLLNWMKNEKILAALALIVFILVFHTSTNNFIWLSGLMANVRI